MDLLLEILAYLLFVGLIYFVQLCIRHKNITIAVLLAILVVVDVYVLWRYFW